MAAIRHGSIVPGWHIVTDQCRCSTPTIWWIRQLKVRENVPMTRGIVGSLRTNCQCNETSVHHLHKWHCQYKASITQIMPKKNLQHSFLRRRAPETSAEKINRRGGKHTLGTWLVSKVFKERYFNPKEHILPKSLLQQNLAWYPYSIYSPTRSY